MTALFILSGFLFLVGSIWILQGANVLLGSQMSGDPFWGWVGVAVLVGGIAVLGGALRRRRQT